MVASSVELRALLAFFGAGAGGPLGVAAVCFELFGGDHLGLRASTSSWTCEAAKYVSVESGRVISSGGL
jgi:hypothetical protein